MTIDIATISSDEELIALLANLGFVAESGDRIRISIDQQIPSCCIYPKSNPQLTFPVALTVEKNGLVLYFYNQMNDWFNQYDCIANNISETLLKQSILDASAGKTFKND